MIALAERFGRALMKKISGAGVGSGPVKYRESRIETLRRQFSVAGASKAVMTEADFSREHSTSASSR
jgi:hypothetical protein